MNHVLTDEECCGGHTEGQCRRCRQCYRWIGADDHDTPCVPDERTPKGYAKLETVIYNADGSTTRKTETIRL